MTDLRNILNYRVFERYFKLSRIWTIPWHFFWDHHGGPSGDNRHGPPNLLTLNRLAVLITFFLKTIDFYGFILLKKIWSLRGALRGRNRHGLLITFAQLWIKLFDRKFSTIFQQADVEKNLCRKTWQISFTETSLCRIFVV